MLIQYYRSTDTAVVDLYVGLVWKWYRYISMLVISRRPKEVTLVEVNQSIVLIIMRY